MFDLSGKVALVTGASRGIGRAIAIALGRAGAFVIVNYRGNEAAAAETMAAIEAAGARAELCRFDVADAEAVGEAIRDCAKRHGRLDILVNNAGIAMDQLLLRIKPEELSQTWATNVNGAIYCAKAAIRPMMRQKQGRIINLSSV
ncbi:MAG: SDR family NAD(P)-dependent oxidoreductase, partial [Myxococcales bacterium]|nr:SDR family NAD(P)-dependent oxidoreductase [Myxococcales bacterium]